MGGAWVSWLMGFSKGREDQGGADQVPWGFPARPEASAFALFLCSGVAGPAGGLSRAGAPRPCVLDRGGLAHGCGGGALL